MDWKLSVLAVIGLAGIGCVIAFNVIGSYVDAQGFLREPFFLAPVGVLLVLTGFGGGLLLLLWRGVARLRARRKV